MCSCCCANDRAEKASPRQFVSIVASRNQRPKVVLGPATTEPGGAKGRRSISPWIRFGQLLALTVTVAEEGDRSQVAALAKQVQQVTGVGLCRPGLHRAERRRSRTSTRHSLGGGLASHGQTRVVLLPKRWVVERSFAWAPRFRRLARNYERLDTTSKVCTSSPAPSSCA